MKKNTKNTKGKIVMAAWKLFYEQGYDNTTIEDIIDESKTSKGSFYHYFEGKDALLGSLSEVFDDKYEEIMETLDENMNSFDTLIMLNRELFDMIETGIDMELLTRMYSSQLVTKGEKHLLNNHRVYYKLLKKIVSEGQKRKELTSELTVNEIVKIYAMCERALIYDWCLCNGSYSLKNYSSQVFPLLLGKIKSI